MLSLSADITESDIDLQLINGDETVSDGDIKYGTALMRFAEAVAGRNEEALTVARNTLLREAGEEVLVDAAAVAGNFQRMVRIADGTGIPIDQRMNALTAGMREDLGIDQFGSAANTAKVGGAAKAVGRIAQTAVISGLKLASRLRK